MMHDRILMSDGKAQIYGSQITQNLQTNEWELYHLEKPESVDKRRLEVGLGPLEEYLRNWNMTFIAVRFDLGVGDYWINSNLIL